MPRVDGDRSGSFRGDALRSVRWRRAAQQPDTQALEFRDIYVEDYLNGSLTQTGTRANRPTQRVAVTGGKAGIDINEQRFAASDDGGVQPHRRGKLIPHGELLPE